MNEEPDGLRRAIIQAVEAHAADITSIHNLADIIADAILVAWSWQDKTTD